MKMTVAPGEEERVPPPKLSAQREEESADVVTRTGGRRKPRPGQWCDATAPGRRRGAAASSRAPREEEEEPGSSAPVRGGVTGGDAREEEMRRRSCHGPQGRRREARITCPGLSGALVFWRRPPGRRRGRPPLICRTREEEFGRYLCVPLAGLPVGRVHRDAADLGATDAQIIEIAGRQT